MKCFHHNDLDGKASAFCVHAWVGIEDIDIHNTDECMYKITYGMPFPFDIIQPNEQVWIVDYSIPPEEMEKLLSITKNVTWIDHHKTAIDKYKDFPHEIAGIRKIGEAGCVLTYKYIHWWSARGQKPVNLDIDASENFPIPRMIELIGDMDVWTWKYGDETKFFTTACYLHDTSPSSDFWWKCMDHEIKDVPNTGNKQARIKGLEFWNQLLKDGELIDTYKKNEDGSLNKSLGFECTFEGHKCWAVNRARCGSNRLGDRIHEYDIIMAFSFNGEYFTVTLYSEKVDVSVIAKKHGGGGHVGASGFPCNELPFKKDK